MHNLTKAEFLGTPVSILDHLGRRWMTSEEIGKCLGYSDPLRKVIHLYHRHADEFGAEDQGVVKLGTPGGIQDTRIFSQTGCILLAMFANTARAKDFRAWAKRVLAASALPGRTERAPVLPGRPRITRSTERQALEMFAAGLHLKSIAGHLGISVAAASHLVNGVYRFAPGAGEDETTPELIAQVQARHRAAEMERIAARFCASAANQRLVAALDDMGREMLKALADNVVEG